MSPVTVGDFIVAALELSDSERRVLTGKWSVRHHASGALAVVRGLRLGTEEIDTRVGYSCASCLEIATDCLHAQAVRRLVEGEPHRTERRIMPDPFREALAEHEAVLLASSHPEADSTEPRETHARVLALYDEAVRRGDELFQTGAEAFASLRTARAEADRLREALRRAVGILNEPAVTFAALPYGVAYVLAEADALLAPAPPAKETET